VPRNVSRRARKAREWQQWQRQRQRQLQGYFAWRMAYIGGLFSRVLCFPLRHLAQKGVLLIFLIVFVVVVVADDVCGY